MNLTSTNFDILKELDNALCAFSKTNLYSGLDVIRERHAQIVNVLDTLEAAFPEDAKRFLAYYEDEEAYLPFLANEPEQKLFDLLLLLHIFKDMDELGGISDCISGVKSSLISFAVFFEDFDSEIHFC